MSEEGLANGSDRAISAISRSGKREEHVLDAIRKGAVTMKEIIEATRISRITLYKYLAVLEARGLVKSRYVGSAKIYLANATDSGKIQEDDNLWKKA